MYEEEIHFEKLLLKQSDMVLTHLSFDPVTLGSIGSMCCPGQMCGPSLRKIGQGVLKLLVGNGFGTFYCCDLDLWPKNQKVSSASQDGCVNQVWGRYVKVFLSYWSEMKRLQMDGRTYRPTCGKQYAPSSSKGSIIRVNQA